MTKITEIVGLEEFLEKQNSAVLTVPIDEKGTIHSSALLYAHNENPLHFIFVTGEETEKCKLLVSRKEVTGSLVIGTERGTPFSLQMRGKVSLKNVDESADDLDIYEQKRGKRTDDITDTKQIVLIFTPIWARCTDYVSKNYNDGFVRHKIDL